MWDESIENMIGSIVWQEANCQNIELTLEELVEEYIAYTENYGQLTFQMWLPRQHPELF